MRPCWKEERRGAKEKSGASTPKLCAFLSGKHSNAEDAMALSPSQGYASQHRQRLITLKQRIKTQVVAHAPVM